nr:hypothetical protein [Tanacetum cinerariifolium]
MMLMVPVEEVYVEALQNGNHTETYQIFADMLKKFNRDDLIKLWDFVKERFSTTNPTDDKEKELWVELKRLFEPDTKDELWKLQRHMHDPLTWRLYDTCGVYHVSTEKGMDIFMLIEKEHPLLKGLMTMMLVNKLLIDQYSEMTNELVRKIFMQQLKRLSFDEIKNLFEATMKRVQTFTLMKSDVDRIIPKIADESLKKAAEEEELEQESSKRQKTGESSEPREKKMMN